MKKKSEKRIELFDIELKTIDKDNSTLEAIFSTSNEDRHGDVVVQDWDLKFFKKNPVILNSHDYRDATKVIGKAINAKVVDGKLQGKIKFAVDENPEAKIIFDLYAGGFLSAFSVGFIAKEFDDKGKILKSELLEISAVSVPANAMALAKAKGIDVDKLTKKKDGKRNEDNGVNKDSQEKSKSTVRKLSKSKGSKVKKQTKVSGLGKAGDLAKVKTFERWDETNEYVRYKVRDIAEFEILERITFKVTFPKIEAVAGFLKGDDSGKGHVQMLFFPKNDGWTTDDAKKWLVSRQFKGFTNDGKEPVKAEPKVIEKELNSLLLIKEAVDEKAEKAISALNRINKAINIVGQASKNIEKSSVEKRAEKIRLINRSIKSLVKLKKE